jgi:sn-glycerol 3-phosphate transport system permease protein
VANAETVTTSESAANGDATATDEAEARARAARVKRVGRTGRIARYTGLVLAASIVMFPVYSAFVVSVQPAAQLFEFPGILLPTSPDFGTFGRAFDRANLDQFLINSAIVSVVITLGQVVSSVLAAYAFAFLRFPLKGLVFAAFLATLMIPAEVTLVANLQTIQDLGWFNTYQALTVPFLAFAFGTFLIRQAFLGIPAEMRDAAALDGYGHWGFLRHVAVPLAKPSIAALALFSFLMAWNQYLWPLLITEDDDHRTVQIGLKMLAAGRVDEFNLVRAGTVVAALPILILLLLFQRNLVRGLTAGALKG